MSLELSFFSANEWDQVNDRARQLLGKIVDSNEVQIQCFAGLLPALSETFLNTASFLAHKKTLGIFQGQSWAQEALLPQLLRENYQIKHFTLDQLNRPQEVLDALDAETSCVLWPEDHPLTGELFDGSELETALAKKRIWTFRISHESFLFRSKMTGPYSIRICSIHSSLAVALLGARYRTPTGLAPWQSWKLPSVESSIKARFDQASENEALVRQFESKLKSEWKPWLSTPQRLWNRTLIWSPKHSGDRVLHDLNQRLPSAGSQMSSLHLCQWSATMRHFSWWQPAPAPDQLRGSVILSADLLTHPEVQSYFCES